jgi:hypothetical protein
MKLKVILESDVTRLSSAELTLEHVLFTNYVRKHARGNDLKHKNRVQISPVRVYNDAQCTKTKVNYMKRVYPI